MLLFWSHVVLSFSKESGMLVQHLYVEEHEQDLSLKLGYGHAQEWRYVELAREIRGVVIMVHVLELELELFLFGLVIGHEPL
jgi:hypothetical protein